MSAKLHAGKVSLWGGVGIYDWLHAGRTETRERAGCGPRAVVCPCLLQRKRTKCGLFYFLANNRLEMDVIVRKKEEVCLIGDLQIHCSGSFDRDRSAMQSHTYTKPRGGLAREVKSEHGSRLIFNTFTSVSRDSRTVYASAPPASPV